jgi:hypothetical protein
MGPWIVGMCDSWSNSSTAAESAFSEAFPPHKQREALLFCFKDVSAFLKENCLQLFTPGGASV